MPHGVRSSFLKPYRQLFSLFYNLQVLWCKVYAHSMGWCGRQLSHICHLCSACGPPGSQPLSPCLENGGENKDWRETRGVVPKNRRACLPSFWLHPCPVAPLSEGAPVYTLRSHQGWWVCSYIEFWYPVCIMLLLEMVQTTHTSSMDFRWVQVKVFSKCFLGWKSSAVGWEKIVQKCWSVDENLLTMLLFPGACSIGQQIHGRGSEKEGQHRPFTRQCLTLPINNNLPKNLK